MTFRIPWSGGHIHRSTDIIDFDQAVGDITTNPIANIVFVSDLTDLPTPVLSVITLLDNITYWFTEEVDLIGNRIVSGVNTVILGSSSENCRIKSTGLIGTALITSNYSLPMRSITIESDVALNLDGDGITTALDWFGVNFTNCATVGTIKDYSNVVIGDGALLNSGGLTFDGNIGTIAFGNCLFDTASGQTAITISTTCIISRRFRMIYSSFVTLSGETSLNVSTSATIPVEGYILDTVNFSGGGTYITGVQHNDNKSLFTACKGINNSNQIGYYTMNGNVTATVVSVITTPYKILGTTVDSSFSQRFSHTNNKSTYIGAITRLFKIESIASLTTGNNQLIYIFIAKNGVVINNSQAKETTSSGSGRSENVSSQTIVELSTNDYIEVFVANYTATTNITVTDLSVIISTVN